eukprot:3676273-Amphidinium_carterae.1
MASQVCFHCHMRLKQRCRRSSCDSAALRGPHQLGCNILKDEIQEWLEQCPLGRNDEATSDRGST